MEEVVAGGSSSRMKKGQHLTATFFGLTPMVVYLNVFWGVPYRSLTLNYIQFPNDSSGLQWFRFGRLLGIWGEDNLLGADRVLQVGKLTSSVQGSLNHLDIIALRIYLIGQLLCDSKPKGFGYTSDSPNESKTTVPQLNPARTRFIFN